jgi:hypothetical protein
VSIKATMYANGMVRPCSRPARDKLARGAKTRSTPWLRHRVLRARNPESYASETRDRLANWQKCCAYFCVDTSGGRQTSRLSHYPAPDRVYRTKFLTILMSDSRQNAGDQSNSPARTASE